MLGRLRKSRKTRSETADVPATKLSDLSDQLAAVRGDNVNFGGPTLEGESMDLVQKAKIVGIVNTGPEGQVLEE